MVALFCIGAFILVRMYYKDLYKVIFYISIPFILIMLVSVSAGDTPGSEGVGDIVLLLFAMLITEIVLTRFFDKTVVHTPQTNKHSSKKKKR